MTTNLREYLAMVPSNWKSKGRIYGEACEFWVAAQLQCIQCGSTLKKLNANYKCIDHKCTTCEEQYQIKASQKSFIRGDGNIKFVGAEYSTTVASMAGGSPQWNLLLVEYSEEKEEVSKVLLIKKENTSSDNVVPRKPLGPHCRRAGWQGCNFEFDSANAVEINLNKTAA